VCHKAHNEECPSLVLEEVDNYSQAMSCDVCSEPLFCHACCSNYGDKTISTDYGGCSLWEFKVWGRSEMSFTFYMLKMDYSL